MQDNFLKMRLGECAVLKNIRYVKNTPVKRSGFTRWNNQSWLDYGVFKSAHEYIDNDDVTRVLVGTNNGKILEVTTTTRTKKVTGLDSNSDIRFTSALGRVIAVNGANAPRVGNKTVWREFGALPAVSDLAVAASGTGSFTGNFIHIVVPVKELASGTAEIYGDWSNIITTTAASDAQFDLTWTDVSDSRVEKYWIYRTKANLSGPLYYVAAVNTGVEAYTDTMTDANLSATTAPYLGLWGTAPVAKYVAYSGDRVTLANLSGEENAIHFSQRAANPYDVEAFPNANSPEISKIYVPGNGPIKGTKTIGAIGADGKQTNHLFVGQPSSCYLIKDTDPKERIIEISNKIGLINDKAVAQWSSYIFWVDPIEGLMFWKEGLERPWKIGDKIDPIFFGGGNQGQTENQSNSDITMTVYDDQLMITVRNDGTATEGKETYLMDLNSFYPTDEEVAAKTAIFTGPWSNTGLGMAFYLPLAERKLLLFDNQNLEILKYDGTSVVDYIGGTETLAKPRVLTGAFLNETLRNRKSMTRVWVFCYSDNAPTVRVKGDFGNLNVAATMVVPAYKFDWVDDDGDEFEWDDITWGLDGWYAEGGVDFNNYSRWFQLDVEWNTIPNNALAIFGLCCEYTGHKTRVTYY